MSSPSPLEIIFFAALQKTSPDERNAYLDEACAGDNDVRGRVEKMLAAQAQAGNSLEVPTGELGKTIEQPPITEKPSTQIGPYKLLQKIGEGGMGVVYTAEQIEPVQRRVALKVIKAGMDSKQVIARFEAERQALAMMDHQNIAKVLDAGTTDDGRPYFAMELVQGIPLTQYCDRNRLSLGERLKLFVPVCHAVQHAHQKAIIHRDLKPSNILVTLYDGKPVPKVIDFGLAKALQHQFQLTDKTIFTEYGQVLGTLQYMSPEQAEMNALDVDTRTDIYSLGVMLYELLTGTTPLDKETLKENALLECLRVIKEKEPPRPSARLSESGDAITGISEQRKIEPKRLQQILRGELDWIVMKTLEKDRTRRYETANDFAQDIERYLNDDAVEARPPSVGYKVSKFVKRNRALVAAASTIALLIMVGITGTGWFAYKANQSARAEKAQRKIADTKSDEARDAEKLTKQALENSEATLARSNYFLANARWNESRVREAMDLLDSIPERFRQFEWYHCHRQFLGSDMTLYSGGLVTSVAFSPDGETIASSNSYEIQLWDARSGEEIKTIRNTKDTGFDKIIFSPDGTKIAAASQGRNQAIAILDSRTGEMLNKLIGENLGVFGIAFSPDGTRLASSGREGTIIIWSVDNGQQLQTLVGHKDLVGDVVFSPDGTRLASASRGRDGTIKLWDVKNGQEIESINIMPGNTLPSLAFSPDGMRLAVRSYNSVQVLDVNNGNELHRLIGHKRDITSVAFSPDGERIASASWDHTIKIWDADRGRELQTLKGHKDWVWSVAFNSDGSRIASASQDGTVKVWDLHAFGFTSGGGDVLLPTPPLIATASSVRPSVRLSRNVMNADGMSVAAVTKTGELFTWNTNRSEIFQIHTGHDDDISCLAISHDGTKIALASRDLSIMLWDTRRGEQLQTFLGHQDEVTSVAFCADGSMLASASVDGTVKLWDPLGGSLLRTLNGHSAAGEMPLNVTFSPDGAIVASAGYEIILWDTESGDRLQIIEDEGAWHSIVAFNPDGTLIATASTTDNNIKLWDARSGEGVAILKGHSSRVNSIAFSPDGDRVASTGRGCKLWDWRGGEELRTLEGGESVTFSPDGTRLVTGNWYGKIYRAPRDSEIRTFRGHTDRVTGVCFSPNGAHIASIDRRGTIILRDTSSGSELQRVKAPMPKLDRAPHRGQISYVSRIFFSVGGERIHCLIGTRNVAWDVITGNRLPGTWPREIHIPQLPRRVVSPDGRLQVLPDGNNVLLVDLNFKNTAEEKAYRESKSKLDSGWHFRRAVVAERKEDWYSATFHRAWVMKADPRYEDACDKFRAAHEKLKAEFDKQEKDLDHYLHPIVQDMLKILPGLSE